MIIYNPNIDRLLKQFSEYEVTGIAKDIKENTVDITFKPSEISLTTAVHSLYPLFPEIDSFDILSIKEVNNES